MSFHGHFWTIAPHVRDGLFPAKLSEPVAWSTPVPDDQRTVELTGWLTEKDTEKDGGTLVIIVHGLGGSPDANYVKRAARAVEAAGFSNLRMAVRGADRSGADMYHAGLTADLQAALASTALKRFKKIALLGFSMGGHVSLRYAAEGMDPRVLAVAAVCPPLDLRATAEAIDVGAINVYRRHLLVGLKEIYAKANDRQPMPTPMDRVKKISRMVEWDGLTVAPRFGFPDAETYYAEMSAGPVLNRIQTPTLIVAAAEDPMIPVETLRPFFETASDAVTAVVSPQGGHVGWPAKVDLGMGPARGLDEQVVDWIQSQF